MDDQRDLISNHEQLPMLGQRPRAQERYVGTVEEGTQVLGRSTRPESWEV